MRWVFELLPRRVLGAAMALGLGLASAASAQTNTAALPPASAIPAAPVPTVAPAAATVVPTATCASAPYADLMKSFGKQASASVFPSSNLLPSGAPADFTLLPPSGLMAGQLRIRAFLGLIPAESGAPPVSTRELQVLSVVHPAQLTDPAKAIGADPQAAYDVQAIVGSRPSWWLAQQKQLVVIACDVGASGTAQPVAIGEVPIWISNKNWAVAIGLVTMAIFYVAAAAIRYYATKTAGTRADVLRVKLSQLDKRPVRVSSQAPELSFRQSLDPIVLSADVFNQASLSQLQILFFFLLAGYGVTFSLFRTGTLSELSPSIVILLGIPAAGAVANQAVNANRDRFSVDNWTWLVSHHVLAADDPGAPRAQWSDVLMTAGQIDLYKLQAFAFSVIVGGAMIYSGFTHLETFKVPDTLLQIMGLSQVVFVGGRLTKPMDVGDADAQVTKLRQSAADLIVAASTGVDINSNGMPLRPVVPGAPVNQIANIEQARAIVPNAVARYESVANEAEIVLQNLTYRDVVTDQLRDPFAWHTPAAVVTPVAGPAPQPQPDPPAAPEAPLPPAEPEPQP